MQRIFKSLNEVVIRLLRKSQRYTGTDMVYLAQGGTWIISGHFATSVLSLGTAIAFANLVPSETYGTYKYIISIAGIFVLFSLPGLNIAYARAVAKGNEHSLSWLTRSRIKYSLLGTFVSLIASGYYFLNDNLLISTAFIVIAATLPFFETFTLYLSYFIGIRKFDLRTKYHIIAQAVSAVSLIVTILLTDDLIVLLLAYFIPLSLIRCLLFFKLKHSFFGFKQKVKTEQRDPNTLRYGKHLTAITILGVVANQMDKIFLWKFFGPIQLAIYVFATTIPDQMKGPLTSIGELAFPKFAARTSDEIRDNLPAIWRKTFIYGLGLLIVIVLYIFAAPFIFKILFPEYIESVTYSQIYALGLISGTNAISLKLLEAQQKTKAQYTIQTIRPITLMILFAVLIPMYGILGAVLAILINRLLFTIYNIVAVILSFRK